MDAKINFETEIRIILAKHARLGVDIETLSSDADLFQAGMTSLASVNVMLTLEDKFDIEFPDELLKRSVFSSIDTIRNAVEGIIPS
jgi:acyl carrier protein